MSFDDKWEQLKKKSIDEAMSEQQIQTIRLVFYLGGAAYEAALNDAIANGATPFESMKNLAEFRDQFTQRVEKIMNENTNINFH